RRLVTQFAEAVVQPPASTQLTVTGAGAAPGKYELTVNGNDSETVLGTSLNVNVSSNLPAAASLLLPADGATEVSTVQPLYWSAAAGAQGYNVDVATDAAFTKVIASGAGLEETVFSLPASLQPGAQYFWRVTTVNACGEAASVTGSFLTAADECTLVASQDTPVFIPDDEVITVSSTISVSVGGVVSDVDVIALRGLHTWINDISMQLEGPLNANSRSPASQERPVVQIMNQSCDDEDDFELNFDDEAPPGPWPCPPVGAGTYQPSNPLAAFDGSFGDGDWVLRVSDAFALDGGQLDSWGLNICVTPVPQVPGNDGDGDGISDDADNCTLVANPSQRDTDSDGYGNFCDPDLNNDGAVNFADLALLKQEFFATGDLDADFNGDGAVNFSDLAIQKALFFQPPGPSALAP
ncbi:MAG: dockerin type I domain-containing protein, partial [Pseudomonadota bacterium]